jgi:predicted RNase H-like HicB family nuclease
MNRYPIHISWSDEDGCYVADVPDLETCSAFGDTPAEALREAEIAMENWLAAARELGRPIPTPRSRAQAQPVAR